MVAVAFASVYVLQAQVHVRQTLLKELQRLKGGEATYESQVSRQGAAGAVVSDGADAGGVREPLLEAAELGRG